MGAMSRALNDLSATFRPRACALIARAVEAGIPVMIVDTLRTPEEQAANIANGVSWTPHSKHLADASGKANAIDICPYEQFQLHGPDKLRWNGDDPVWAKLGALGEALGLRWGGRWTKRDLGHFELA